MDQEQKMSNSENVKLKNCRDVSIITQKIIDEIPDSQVILKEKLTYYINSLWNLAPEVLMSSHVWIPVQDILNSYIKMDQLNEPWVKKTICIFNDYNE
jgi:hypothetical protein